MLDVLTNALRAPVRKTQLLIVRLIQTLIDFEPH